MLVLISCLIFHSGMAFDPRALRNFLSTRPQAPPPTPSQAKKKGKKRPRDPAVDPALRGPGEPSRPQPQAAGPSPPSHVHVSPPPRAIPRPPPQVVDLDDEPLPQSTRFDDDFERCHLVPDIVAKYKDEVKLSEGLKQLEIFTMKVVLGPLQHIPIYAREVDRD